MRHEKAIKMAILRLMKPKRLISEITYLYFGENFYKGVFLNNYFNNLNLESWQDLEKRVDAEEVGKPAEVRATQLSLWREEG